MVGGTALTFHRGHRDSIDIDLFKNTGFEIEPIKDFLTAHFKKVIYTRHGVNLLMGMVDGVKIDFAAHKYPWIGQSLNYNHIKIASEIDIAAMKLSAIAQRGFTRDFIDYVELLKDYTLKQMLDFYKRKYNQYNVFQVIKSLTFFEDAEKNPSFPKMKDPLRWEDVKTKVIKSIEEYQRQKGLSM